MEDYFMKRMLLTVMLCCFVLPGLIMAQGTTTAAFNGLVTDSDGNPVVGAAIAALHNPTGTVYSALSRLDGLYNALTLGGRLTEPEDVGGEWVRDSVLTGALPEGTTLETLKEKGYVRFIDWGISALGLNQAAPLKPDETHAAFRWHVEDKLPYPTATRRAQFYIDHDWFLEAGEELPVHKDHPKVGGDYPFQMTSGHNRWSIHSMNITNRIMQDTHRGRPHLVMNTDDAKARGIEDHEEVRVFNDGGSFITPVKLSPSVRPGQVIAYNGWEPLQYREWRCPSDTEIGMIKWLHMAGGYGHLRYWPIQWQPAPSDRAIHVDVKKLD